MVIFSIIVPTYNRKEKLLKCIKSLQNQDFDHEKYEIIVVDDGSNDGTYQILKKEDVIPLRINERSGPSVARNFGIEKANGKYIAFTDSDCEVPKNWLASFYKAYKENPDIVGVGGSIGNPGNGVFEKYETACYQKYEAKSGEYISKFRDEYPFALGNMSYTKAALELVGGFNEKIPYYCSGEDAQLKGKILKRRKKLLYIPIAVTHNHTYSISSFYKQSLERGAAMLLDSKRKLHFQKRFEVVLRLLLCPLYFLYSLIRFKLNLLLAYADLLAFVYRNIGKLKYYKKIKNIKV